MTAEILTHSCCVLNRETIKNPIELDYDILLQLC